MQLSKIIHISRYLRSELSKQEQSSSEMVRSLLGKSPKKEEKQVMVQPAEDNSPMMLDGRPIPASEQVNTKVVMVEPAVKEGSEICEPQSAKAEENTEAEMMQKHVTAQMGSPSKDINKPHGQNVSFPETSNSPSASNAPGAATSTTCNGGSPPTISAIPRIEVEAAREPVIPSSSNGLPNPSNGLPKHITSPPTGSPISSPAAPSPSRIPSRQQPSSTSSSTQHQQSSPNSSQGHSPVGLQGGFDLKTGVGGQVGGQVSGQNGGQEELRKLESRIERFVSRSSGSECRC